MPLIDYTTPFRGGPTFFTGTGNTSLVPDVFPVAINGRPYMIDMKSGRFTRQFDNRVRDSVDQSTAPGEAAVNPQGLWRRGQVSWHLGAGQKFADTAEGADYRFYKSKGVNPWTKGQLSLLNATKLSLSSAATTQHMVVQGGRIYVSLGGDVKYTTDPFATSPTWSDCTGEPGGDCQAMATDGYKIYLAFPNDGVRQIIPNVSVSAVSGTKFVNSTENYYMLGFAKQYMFGAHDHELHLISKTGSKSVKISPDDAEFRWVGVATGQNAAYAAGSSGKKSVVYKITIDEATAALNTGSVALELPTGETATAISGYLGFILLGTNKGVRFCSTDGNSNLVSGPLIPTGSAVNKFSSNERFSYFTWSNYDGVSSGLGRLDLSQFTSANSPAYATDVMYSNTGDATNVVIFDNKAVFMISGIGVAVEDSNNFVASGTLETGFYRWGIPDRKFAPRFDIRMTPLVGSVGVEVSFDNGSFTSMGTYTQSGATENTFNSPENKFIEAAYRLTLTRSAGISGPTVTRWMSRAYAAPVRSRLISVPILLHETIRVQDKDYFFDVEYERDALENLVSDPRIISYQERGDSYSVIVEDVQWQPIDSSSYDWLWEGTAVVIMRTVSE